MVFSGYFLDFLVKIYGSGVDREVREGVGFISSDFGPNPTAGERKNDKKPPLDPVNNPPYKGVLIKYLGGLGGVFGFVFSKFCLLVAGFGYFRPRIRILRKKSRLQPAGNVWKPKSRSS